MPFDPNTFFIVDKSMANHTVGGLLEVGYLSMKDGYDAYKDGTRIAAFRIVPANAVALSERLMVYWCGFAANSVQYTVLTDKANFMLTPTMDGCSFGIGHHTKDSIIVSHANMESVQKKGEYQSMQKSQASQLKNFFKKTGGPIKRMMSPSDYRLHKDAGDKKARAQASATTFGVRTGNRWNFYRHRYLEGMGTYDVLDTKKI